MVKLMRRLALLIGILGLLANSFDCYGAWIISKQARDCCKSGHCSRTNHDPCCSAAPSGSNQLFVSQHKVNLSPAIVAVAVMAITVRPTANALILHQPLVGSDIPPPLAFRSDSLPLLI